MGRSTKSVLELMEEKQAPVKEIAATAMQQRMMAESGKLQEVNYIGPNGQFIPGYYSPEEVAFLPQFKIED